MTGAWILAAPLLAGARTVAFGAALATGGTTLALRGAARLCALCAGTRLPRVFEKRFEAQDEAALAVMRLVGAGDGPEGTPAPAMEPEAGLERARDRTVEWHREMAPPASAGGTRRKGTSTGGRTARIPQAMER